MICQLVFLTLVGATPAADPSEEERRFVRQVATGTWGTEFEVATCLSNPHTSRFSPDGRTMFLRYAKGEAGVPPADVIYQIVGGGPDYLRMKVEGETRTTDAGVTVVWDLVLLSADSFCWHRTDWQENGCTKPITRCKENAVK